MRSHHGHGRRFGRPGGWQQADQPDAADAPDWFAGRLPDAWFTGDPEVVVDREEITVIGQLPEPEGSEGEGADARGTGRAARFREFLSSIDLAALMLDSPGRVVFINDYLLRLLGRTREEMLGRDWIDLAVPARERPALREVFNDAMSGRALSGTREDGIVTRSGFRGASTLDESLAFGDRDSVLVPRGYHTVSTPPGYDLYYLNVMAGPTRLCSLTRAEPPSPRAGRGLVRLKAEPK